MPSKATAKSKGQSAKGNVAKKPAATKVAASKVSPAAKAPAKKTISKKPQVVKEDTLRAEVAVKKTPPRAVKADVVDTKGKVVESMSLPGAIFGAKVNPDLMAQAVRVYLINQRQGTVSTQSRGEVTGSTRKIYRQKGTGRARHGAASAPIFVKGGLAHGPKPKDYSLKLSKKMRKASLFSALTTKLQEKQVKIVSGLEKLPPKTKEMAAVLQKLELSGKKPQNILLVLPMEQEKNQTLMRISRNIDGVTYAQASQLNTYDVLKTSTVLIVKDAVTSLERHFLRKEEK